MARQQQFDWYSSQQRLKKTSRRKPRQNRQRHKFRSPGFEPLEARVLLSVNTGQPAPEIDLSSNSVDVAPEVAGQERVFWYVPEGESLPENWEEPTHEESVESDEPQAFSAVAAWEDQDPDAEGIQLFYSYSNFFDGGMGDLSEEDLRAATEEALGLWASVAPLHFIEMIDSGPMPDVNDTNYDPADHPNIRIGHHFIDGGTGQNVLAHAFFPISTDINGLAGDVHFDNSNTWGIGAASGAIDIIEVMTHELGHSLGLGHEFTLEAIMNPFYGARYPNLGDGFLLQDDINGIQELYGEGEGSVTPLGSLMVNTIDDGDDTMIMVAEDGSESLVDATPDILTLREAINFATFSEGRLQVGFDEEVFVTPQLMQTISLDPNLGPLDISTNMTILGPGSDLLTLEPDPGDGFGFRIFEITPGDPEQIVDSLEVSIAGLSLTGGFSEDNGGAIHNDTANLTLQDIHLFDNMSQMNGGAVYSSGPLSIGGSTIGGTPGAGEAGVGLLGNTASEDGGGIYTTNMLTVTDSTFYGNAAEENGGGIAFTGEGNELLIQSTTISGNHATEDGGGVHVFDINPFRLRLLHSTVFDNSTDGAGGGIFLLNGTLVTDHSIVARNVTNSASALDGPDIDSLNVLGNPQVLANYTLIGDNTQANVSELIGNIIGDSSNPVNPRLAPLADNGGATMTHSLAPNSPALDSGDEDVPLAPEFDQRGLGFDRIVDVIDLGALETNGFNVNFVVNTLVDENDPNPTPEDQSLSLREAISLANAALGPDSITFAPELSGGVIELLALFGELQVTDSVTIDAGDLPFGLTVDAGAGIIGDEGGNNSSPGHRVFNISDSDSQSLLDVSIEGLTLQGGNATGNGGAILSLENLHLHTVSILGNTSTGDGGGVYHREGALTIEDSTIANNTASNNGDGGGLWSSTSVDDPLTGLVRNSTFSGNNAGDEGGGLFNGGGLLSLEFVTITNNNATIGGGAVSFGDVVTETTVYNSIISGNTLDDPDLLGFDVQRSRLAPLNGNTFTSLGYNLIGEGNAVLAFNQNGDQTEERDPGLGPLANNGGKTLTHAVLPDSLALDAGDPEAILPGEEATETSVLVPAFDQRGESFTRIADGDASGSTRIDIGAFELPEPEPSADFDDDGDTDGADFLAWQRGFGKTDAERQDGDANFDGVVNSDDLNQWTEDYGKIGPAESSITPATETLTAASTEGGSLQLASVGSVAAKSNVGTIEIQQATQGFVPQVQIRSASHGASDLLSDGGLASDYSLGRERRVSVELVTANYGASQFATSEHQGTRDLDQGHDSLDEAFESLDRDSFFGFGWA